MEKIYNPQDIEQPLYELWEHHGYFKPNGNPSKESFCIVLPPPNITGNLHMGHAFQQTIMDIIIRYNRMLGKNTLWQGGLDHAGIATQIIVERQIILEEGKTCINYNRNDFIKKIWRWTKKSSSVIISQMKRLGNSIDWDSNRFTMDKEFSDTVNEVFIRLYKEKLIYRGKRLVNWDPKLHTAISDLEVEYFNKHGFMWYIRYPLVNGIKTFDGKNYLTVATTRPETILGDTAIAVNPKDSRYNNLIGKFVISPIINRIIPIIGDEYPDIEKGTGCMKITPGHDFVDYKIGRKHHLSLINIFTCSGNIRKKFQIFDFEGKKTNVYSDEIPIEFQNMERFAARKTIIKIIKNLGLLEDIKSHNLMVPYGDRSGVIIEPMLTDQWYIHTSPLTKTAIKAVKNDIIKFIPKQYENMYFTWMNNIHDWCISRQIWWGHRIPAWYDNNGNIYVGHSESDIRNQHNLSQDIILTQDNDVLDTWFSSSLWTFGSLGWPQDTSYFRTFHPTQVLVSGFDIIFFWIARMIMLTMHFIKDKTTGNPQIPFKTIYITGLIRDDKGQKMSKSKGNVIDPIDIIDGISLESLIKKRTNNMMKPQLEEEIKKNTRNQFPNGIDPYGTDALRFTLSALSSSSRDINWDMNRLKGYRNFCNKLWNASRFVLMNIENKDFGQNNNEMILSLADRWILTEFNDLIKAYRSSLDSYRFDLAANLLYEFIWNQFCDWYLELTKPILFSKSTTLEKRGTRHTLIYILEKMLCLAHPIIPFITEVIWQRIKILKNIANNHTIMLQKFPEFDASKEDYIAKLDMDWIKQMIVAIRHIRTEINIKPRQLVDVLLRDCSTTTIRRIEENYDFIVKLACLSSLNILPENTKHPITINRIIEDAEILIPIGNVINKVDELNRLKKEIDKLMKELNTIESNLDNENFISCAPKEVVIKARKRIDLLKISKEKLLKQQNLIINL